MKLALWLENFEGKTDPNGNPYIFAKKPLVSAGGITAYGSAETQIPSIFDGLPLDNVTIWKNPDTGLIEVIGGTGGGGDFNSAKMWELLLAATTEQINISHLTEALSGYATQSWVNDKGFATQTWVNNQGFITQTAADERYVNVAGDTMTGNLTINSGQSSRLTLWDSSAYLMQQDKTELGGYGLYLYGSSGTYIDNKLFVNGDALINGNLGVGTTSPSQRLHVAGGALIEESTFINCKGTAKFLFFVDNGNSANLGGYLKYTPADKLVLGTRGTAYVDTEALYITRGSKDVTVVGDLIVKGNILSEGGVTAYSLGDRTPSTIMDGVAVDGTTISKEGGVLKVIGSTGGGGGSTAWDDITGKPSWLTTSKPSVSYFTNDAGYVKARNIWGQYYDGSSDITGEIKGCSRIHNNGGSLYLGNSNNASYVYVQDIVSQSGSSYWKITQNGVAYFASKLGVGTTSPSEKIDVVGGGINIQDAGVSPNLNIGYRCGGNTVIRWTGNSYNNLVISSTGGTMYLRPNGTSSETGEVSIDTSGNIKAKGGITGNTSDQRAKTILEELNINLKDIADAPTIRFKWNGWKIKDDGKTHIGGLAQYMQKVLPEAVLNDDDMLYMDYSTTAYIFAVQTARHLVKTDTEVERLKKRVKELEKQLANREEV